MIVYRICHRFRVHPVSGTYEGPYLGEYASGHGAYPSEGGWQTLAPHEDEGLVAQHYEIRPQDVFGCTPQQWATSFTDVELLQWLSRYGYVLRVYVVPEGSYVLGTTQVAFDAANSQILSEEELYVCP